MCARAGVCVGVRVCVCVQKTKRDTVRVHKRGFGHLRIRKMRTTERIHRTYANSVNDFMEQMQ